MKTHNILFTLILSIPAFVSAQEPSKAPGPLPQTLTPAVSAPKTDGIKVIDYRFGPPNTWANPTLAGVTVDKSRKQIITKKDVTECEAFILSGNANRQPFEEGALELLLNSSKKVLILDKCSFRAENIRKFGWNWDKLVKADPFSKGHMPFTMQTSKGNGNQCDIIRIWDLEEKPGSKKTTEAETVINNALNALRLNKAK